MEIESPSFSLAGCWVVTVEDDETLCTVLTDILSGFGARCSAFNNAEDALVHMLQSQDVPDLVVADHGVPGSIKGLEFAEMVHEKWPEIPVLLMSGFLLDTSESTPPLVFVFKPWSIADLVDALGQLMPGRTESINGG